MEIAVKKGRSVRPDIKIGICGEHGGDPSSCRILPQNWSDYVSCSPYRIPIATLAAAQAAIKEKRARKIWNPPWFDFPPSVSYGDHMKNTARLRRSIISVPANREKMLNKAFNLDADVIMLDLETSVSINEKEEARKRAVSTFKEQDWRGKVRSYRINAMDTPFAYRDIIDIVEEAGEYIDTIVVPKVDDPAEIKAIDYLLTQIELRLGFKRPIWARAFDRDGIGNAQGWGNRTESAAG